MGQLDISAFLETSVLLLLPSLNNHPSLPPHQMPYSPLIWLITPFSSRPSVDAIPRISSAMFLPFPHWSSCTKDNETDLPLTSCSALRNPTRLLACRAQPWTPTTALKTSIAPCSGPAPPAWSLPSPDWPLVKPNHTCLSYYSLLATGLRTECVGGLEGVHFPSVVCNDWCMCPVEAGRGTGEIMRSLAHFCLSSCTFCLSLGFLWKRVPPVPWSRLNFSIHGTPSVGL